ncbi:MAG TPA: pyridoxamine 5'-phosphate oxidase family protein [Solirubrobacterales bacterium]
MAKVFERIDEQMRSWIGRQRMYFVGTAPLAAGGHVNVSPKGPIETLSVLDDHTVAYLDLVGSGAETVAHLRENGRIVVMLCDFEGPPRIVRLHGRGEVITTGDARFEQLFERCGFANPTLEEARRSIVLVAVARIADSCGYGVPLMRYEGEREHARLWAEKKLRVGGSAAIDDYVAEKNAASIDGLPAVPARSGSAATLRG